MTDPDCPAADPPPPRVRGEAVRVCPDCDRATTVRLPRCWYCGRGLDEVGVEDSADPPARPPRPDRLTLPAGVSAAACRAAITGLGLIQARVTLTTWAVGLLVVAGVVEAAVDELTGGVRDLPLLPGGLALVLLAVGQLLELFGLTRCLAGPAAGGCWSAAAVALGCQLAAVGLSVTGIHLATGPGGNAVVPVPPTPDRRPDHPPAGSGPRVGVACLAAGGLFVAAGRVASVHFLGRLGRVFRVTEVGGGPRRVFLLAATAVFGPPAVVFAAGFVLPPEVLSVLVLAVALTGLVLVFVLLVNGWRLLDQLRDALGRRLGGGSTPRETRAVRSHPGERPA